MRAESYEQADRLLARGVEGPAVDRALDGLCEVLYRLADGPQLLMEFREWLDAGAKRTPALRPWRSLVELAAADGGNGWRLHLAALDESLGRVNGRPGLLLRTEAARHLYRLTGNAKAAWERLRQEPLPDPRFAEVAAEAVVNWLRLAAAAGRWEDHDQFAAAITPSWEERTAPASARISLTLAENQILRGFYERALRRIRPLEEHGDPGVRFAALVLGLHVRLACGGLPGEGLYGEITEVARRITALAVEEPTTETVLPIHEWMERRRRGEVLLLRVERRGTMRESVDPASTLAVIEAELEAGSAVPDIELRLRLRWVRATLQLHGRHMAATCDKLLGMIIGDAQDDGLPVLEMMAWDLRSTVRRHENRWKEAILDAGHAANLAARQLKRNRNSSVERSLRASFLPIFDQAVGLLAENAEGNTEREQYGKALLDYAEQSMQLALSEARSRIHSAEGQSELFPVLNPSPDLPPSSEDLQAALRPGEAVLQYFLAGRFLLVFCYGMNFFQWSVESPNNADPSHPLPVRAAFLRDLETWRSLREQGGNLNAGGVQRNLIFVPRKGQQVKPARKLEEILKRLREQLLPEQITATLDSRVVSRLIIVPHDVLYRAPFGLLPWRDAVLGTHFGLSLQPTGSLAGTHPLVPWKPHGGRPRVGFVIGPRIAYAKREGKALAAALGRGAEVVFVDTSRAQEGAEAFVREVPSCDVLYLACHGNTPEASVEEARLELGRRNESMSLARVASLPLQRCGLVVLQSCWTGWMVHLRENPVQGFPQALLDAGARAVIAPMVPVDDPLCPLFTAVFGRVLRFLPASEALAQTLRILRRHGRTLAAGDLNAAAAFSDGFEAFEYRFTGDPEIDLTAGRLNRFLARIRLHFWLASQRLWNHTWSLGVREWLRSWTT